MINIKHTNTIVFLIFIFINLVPSQNIKDDVSLEANVHYSEPGRELRVFCYPGEAKTLLHIWHSAHVELDSFPENVAVFQGPNSSAVREQHHLHQASWLPLKPWLQTSSFALPEFSPSCLGLTGPFTLRLAVRSVNYYYILRLAVGLCLFFSAHSLSRNVVFFYLSGMSLGVLASLLIVVYLCSRAVPKKTGAYSVMVLGSSLLVYGAQYAWFNMTFLLMTYRTYLLGYIALAALVGFVVCYRAGPATNVRTLQLIQWALQAIGLILVFFSFAIQEVSMTAILLVLLVHLFPQRWSTKIRLYWMRKFPPKVKLLTEEQYVEQGVVETRKALQELRQYCKSPDCKAWETLSNLKDPLRFLKFVAGDSHLRDEEILQYDCHTTEAWTDDESGDEQPMEH